jgi:hypothetical protein
LRCSFFEGSHQLRVGQELLDLVFGRNLAVHVAKEVRELLARLQQLGERGHLPGNLRRPKSSIFLKPSSTPSSSFASSPSLS